MKYFKPYILLCILILTTFTNCKKFVELDAPKTLLVTKNVFASDETAIAQLTGIYSQMSDREFMPYRLPFCTGIGGDELINHSALFTNAYENSLQAVDAVTNAIWTAGYNYIYEANAIYEGCAASTTLSPAVKKQLMAEALFIRAFWHFYLVNLYGDVPLATTTDYLVNSTLARSAKDLVYQQIITDLKNAQAGLNENYVGSNSIATTTDRVRPNKMTATALLARVYLFNKNYSDAEAQATVVINSKPNYDLVDVTKVFLKNSNETIWALMKPTPANSINTWEGNYFILTSAPKTSFQNSAEITPTLLSAFDDGDKRKINWIGKFTDMGVTPNVDYYYPFKYKVLTSASVSEYSLVFRVAEQYLIRAEARVQLGNLAGGINDTDAIRNRAGIALIKDINPGIGKTDLLNVILKERQKELFTEWGHRWIDLKRTGNIDAAMNAIAASKGTVWNSNQQLWPIPQKEILNDKNLAQNPGYN
ncbi:RagB/SusD family nutrient uptake outer membrane protein [Chitinophaga oryziterrae]|nr:RagB/SusD family nutrient uptake outer membrane protein [Chitinophaga oryziterrae]